MKTKNKRYLRLLLLLVIVGVFIYYAATNQNQFSRLSQLTWWQAGLIVSGQLFVFFSNAAIAVIFVRFIQKKLLFSEAVKLTAYSSLVNFFGFLQGGIGVRAVFFKQKFEMKLRQYLTLVSLQYAMLFGASAVLIFGGVSLINGFYYVYLTLLAVLVLAVIVVGFRFKAAWLVIRKLMVVFNFGRWLFQRRPLTFLAAMIILQLVASLLTNWVELAAVGANVTASGLMVYTGLSQFSLLVAITPGAIGIREGLLLLAQTPMHLTTQDIILASTTDRLLYFVTLALVTPVALSAKTKLLKN